VSIEVKAELEKRIGREEIERIKFQSNDRKVEKWMRG